jgi:hypothetical protein
MVRRQMPHTGDKGGCNGAVIGPLGKDFVDGGIVDFSLALAIFGYNGPYKLDSRLR